MSKLADAAHAFKVLIDVSPVLVGFSAEYAERVRGLDTEKVKKGLLDAREAVEWLEKNGALIKAVVAITKDIPVEELTARAPEIRAAVLSALGRTTEAAA